MLRALFILISISCIFNVSINAQQFQALDVELLDVEGNSLFNPTLGALIAPQFSAMNYDEDSIDDLFVFDRSGNTVLPFKGISSNGNITYKYMPEWSSSFPSSLHSWVLLRDYNGDGIVDIFSAPDVAGIPGIQVYKGRREEGRLTFTLIEFPTQDFNVLYYPASNNDIIIYSAFSDIPGIIDTDGDGDLDIVSFDVAGSNAFFYKNLSVENGFEKDTFIMVLDDLCWGKFKEDEFSSEITLSDDMDLCSQGFRNTGSPRHSGSTLSFPDINRDGVYDLLLGDLTFDGVSLLQNGGTSDDAFMTSVVSRFPAYNVPIRIDEFTATYMVDINQDGKDDLIAAPNNRLNPVSDESIWYYRDLGGDTARYELENKNFLVDNTINIGGFSDPALIDVDADGDQDLLVGTTGINTVNNFPESTVFLFENISEGDQLKFQLKSDNFLNIKALSNETGRYSPATGDLDNDGDIDLLIGETNGQLIYYENTAEQGMAPLFGSFIFGYAEISIGQHAKPQIVDVDGDGLSDILVGERNDNRDGAVLGGINYFRNIGTTGNPSFNSDPTLGDNTSAFAGIFTRDQGVTVGSSSPHVFVTDETVYGVVGSQSGQVKLYRSIEENIYSETLKLKDNILPYGVGGNSTVVGGDLNGNEYIDFIVGSGRGSLHFFESSITFTGSSTVLSIDDDEVLVFPNPSMGNVTVVNKGGEIELVEVFSLTGKRISTTNSNLIYIEHPGTYLLCIQTDHGRVVKKIMVY